MGVVYFYHLTRQPMDVTLPTLLAKARSAGWRVAVRGTKTERMAWLDERLWLGGDEAFLPHGLAGGEFDADQPVLLTTKTDLPNGAVCLMSIDGAAVTAGEVDGLQRVCILFDGNDASAVECARGQWRALTDAGCAAQYWSQEGGNWAMKSESKGAVSS